jgi:hypothetical protein
VAGITFPGPHECGSQEVKVAQFAIFLGSFWLVVAVWLDAGWSEEALWAGVLPAVWLVTLPILMSNGGNRSGG